MEPDGRPEYLRQQAIKSREKLGLEQIGLWQLHSIDPRVPRDEQFAAVKSLQKQDEGIIRHVGSATFLWRTLKPLQRSSTWRPCITGTISSIAAAKTCSKYRDRHRIGFHSLVSACCRTSPRGSILNSVARAHNAAPSQLWSSHGFSSAADDASHSGHLEGRRHPGGERRRRRRPALGSEQFAALAARMVEMCSTNWPGCQSV